MYNLQLGAALGSWVTPAYSYVNNIYQAFVGKRYVYAEGFYGWGFSKLPTRYEEVPYTNIGPTLTDEQTVVPPPPWIPTDDRMNYLENGIYAANFSAHSPDGYYYECHWNVIGLIVTLQRALQSAFPPVPTPRRGAGIIPAATALGILGLMFFSGAGATSPARRRRKKS